MLIRQDRPLFFFFGGGQKDGESYMVEREWSEDGTEIIGLTVCGRATVEALKLNNEFAKQARAIWHDAGIRLPSD